MKSFALISAALAVSWLAVIASLHWLKPDLDPQLRMVSEYARGRHGWIMQVAFACLAASCWTLALALWAVIPHAGLILLVVCGAGCAGAGIFVTDPILSQERIQTRSGALHILLAFGVMIVFPIMATIVTYGLSHVSQSSIIWIVATLLPWSGLAVFIATVIGAVRNPLLPVGLAERFLVVTFSVWQIWAAWSTFEFV